jgi:hypothetical protein
MDYTGLDFGKLRFPKNRPVTTEERVNQLSKSERASDSPNGYLSVISIGEDCLELVDRWYPVKGFNAWLGMMLGLMIIPGFFYFIFVFFSSGYSVGDVESWIMWLFVLVALPVFAFIVCGVSWLIRSECFRWTHYPMRLNRRTRKVHLFRQDGTVLTADWDSLLVCIASAHSPPMGKTSDLRAHVLSDDGMTVLESFTLGYVFLGGEEDLLHLWELVRRYMAHEAGGELMGEDPVFVPVLGRKEGFEFGVARTFAPMIHWPLMQLVVALPFAFIALSRWLAMSTSRIPEWPEEVLRESDSSMSSVGQLDWRNSAPLGFKDKGWPMICTALGALLGCSIVGYIGAAL